MHRLTATDTPMVRYTRTIFPSYADHSPTLFLIVLKNHLIQFQKVNFFSRGTFKNRIIKKRVIS